MYTVYKHTTPNGKVYIGITGQKPGYRWNNGNGHKDNPHFYSAIRKYGWENIRHEIVANGLTKEQACDLEIELIAKHDATDPRNWYNHSTGGECSTAGMHHSVETRKKMSEARKGANSPWYGKHRSAETRRKTSESIKGVNHPNYGKHLSDETRRKTSEANKGKHRSQEARRKMSESYKREISRNRKAVICVETGILHSSGMEAEKSAGISRKSISKVLRGINKTSGGYHWKYAD